MVVLEVTHCMVLQCHGAAEDALTAATTQLKGLLALPAQAAQVIRSTRKVTNSIVCILS